MKRADFEIPIKSPLPYIAALISAAALFFAAFLIIPVPDTDIAQTVNPENVTYAYDLIFRYPEGLPFYDACFMFTYAAFAVLCFIPAAKKRPPVFVFPFVSHIISAAVHNIEAYGKLIYSVIFFFLFSAALFALTAAGIIRVKYVMGILFAVIALIFAVPTLLYKINIMSVCDDIPMIAFFASYALICFSFRKKPKE